MVLRKISQVESLGNTLISCSYLCTYISWNTICLRPSAWPIYTYAVVCFPDEALVACIMVTLKLVTLLSHFCVAGFLTDVLENAIIAMPAY